MALNPKRSAEAANAACDAMAALHNNGYLRIYDGSQPASVSTGITTQVLLAELRYGATAYGAAANGVATANAITKDSDANATGTAAWYRTFKSDGTTAICDGTVGTSGCNLNIPTTSIVQHAEVSINSHTLTETM